MRRAWQSSTAHLVAAVGLFMLSRLAVAGTPPVCARTAIGRAAHALNDRDPCGARDLLEAARRRCRGRGAAAITEYSKQHVYAGRAECRAGRDIRQQMARARAGAPRAVTLNVSSTFEFGCPCPPLVMTTMRDGTAFGEFLIYPLLAPGVRDLTSAPASNDVVAWPPGDYVIRGHFTGVETDRYGWAKLRGQAFDHVESDSQVHFAETHPLFLVKRWCYVPPRQMREYVTEQIRKHIRPADFCHAADRRRLRHLFAPPPSPPARQRGRGAKARR